MLPRHLNVIITFLSLLVIANLVLLDYFFVTQRNELLDLRTRVSTEAESIKRIGQRLYAPLDAGSENAKTGFDTLAPAPLISNACPQTCVSLVRSATASGRSSAPLVAPIINNPVVPTKGEFFIPLGYATLTTISTWTDMNSTTTTFDTNNFSNITAAYFEASLRTSGAGEVQVRLYDTTTPAVFWGAVLKSSSTTGESLSAPISLFKGQKTYRVQMYTSISTGYLDQARIRIVTQ